MTGSHSSTSCRVGARPPAVIHLLPKKMEPRPDNAGNYNILKKTISRPSQSPGGIYDSSITVVFRRSITAPARSRPVSAPSADGGALLFNQHQPIDHPLLVKTSRGCISPNLGFSRRRRPSRRRIGRLAWTASRLFRGTSGPRPPKYEHVCDPVRVHIRDRDSGDVQPRGRSRREPTSTGIGAAARRLGDVMGGDGGTRRMAPDHVNGIDERGETM